jgi:hypothetical protein
MGTGINGLGSALAMVGNDVYVGGSFTAAGTATATNIARWDGANWWSLGSGVSNPDQTASVGALAVIGTNLYVGGYFLSAGTVPASSVARWDGNNWSTLGSGVNSAISAMCVGGTNLYVGGDFTSAGGLPATYIARWDGNAWFAVGSGLQRYPNTLVALGNSVYAASSATNSNGEKANWIAKWDGVQWVPLGSGLNGDVYALLIAGGNLYAGGAFYLAGGKVSAYAVAALIVHPANPIFSVCQNGDFVTRFDGSPAVEYTIEFADVLSGVNWQKATNITAPSVDQGFGVGVFEFRESIVAPKRYYRAAYPAY